MRITRVTLYEAPIALKEPFVISLGPLTHANNVFVRVDTNSGLTGWGEASPFPTIHGETMSGCMTIGQFLARQLIGRDPSDHAAMSQTMDRAIFGNSCIKSALEIACYDLAAQAKQLPLYQYLGAGSRRVLTTDYTISLGSVDEMVAKARWIQSEGYPVIKIKVGEGIADVERVVQIAEAVGRDVPLRLDANQGWTKEIAVAVLQQLEHLNIQHCEAPIDKRDFHHLPAIRQATRIPLMADESCWDHQDARRLLEIGAVDRINIKLSKAGGLFKALKIVAVAREKDVPLQVGGFLETRLGFTAAAHFGLLDGIAFYDFDTPLMQTEDPVLGGIEYGEGGALSVPEVIGLGASLPEAYAEHLKSETIS